MVLGAPNICYDVYVQKKSSVLASGSHAEGEIDKFIKLKKSGSLKLIAQGRITFRDELTKWIGSSICPFNIVSDLGLKIALKTIIGICELFDAFRFK